MHSNRFQIRQRAMGGARIFAALPTAAGNNLMEQYY